ncbi:Snurportin-1 [Balamuthia mandrillaris]
MWGAGEENKEEGGAASSWTPSGGGSFTMGSDPSLASPQASATVDALSGLFSQTLGSATANNHYSKTRLADFKKINEEQGKKRERFLRKQKKARRDLTQYARSLALGPQEGEEEEEDKKDEGKEEAAGTQNRRSRTERCERRNHRDLYRDQLMLPEPMLDIPEDLALIQQKEGGTMVESRWFAVPYPIGGKRCLVISSNGKTTAYLRNGSVFNRFSSNLPAGGGTSSGRSNGGGGGGWRKLHNYCILDCVFEEGKGIYYVLDVVCWKGHLYYDCDTSFRVYWRNTKLMEDAEHATRRMEQNPFPFVPMPFYDCCDPHSIAVAAAKAEGEEQQTAVTFQREALLFYHKDSHYSFGATPLLTYLPIASVDALLEVFRQRLHLVSAATTPEAAGMAVVPS